MAQKIDIQFTADTNNATKGVDGLSGSLNEFDKQAKESSNASKGMWKQFAGGALAAKGITMAINAIGTAITASMDAFKIQEQAIAQMESTLKSTGGAVGITSQELQQMAGQLQKNSMFGDELIISAQSILLTFTKIGSTVFPRAIQAAADMSQKLGTDLKGSTIQLGKALNDPIKGMSALTRSGVSFTEEQKNTVKALQDVGDMAGAQNVILKEMEVQFGGSAKAASETSSGAFKQFEMAIGDISEIFGEGITDGMAPVLRDLVKWADENKEALRDFFNMAGTAIGNIMKTSAKFIAFMGHVADFLKDSDQFEIKPLDLSYINIKNLEKNLTKAKTEISVFETIVRSDMGKLSKRAKQEFTNFQNAIELIETKEPKLRLRLMREELDKLDAGTYTKGLKAVRDEMKKGQKQSEEASKKIEKVNNVVTKAVKLTKEEQKALDKLNKKKADHAKFLKKIADGYKEADAQDWVDTQKELTKEYDENEKYLDALNGTLEGGNELLEERDLITGKTVEETKKATAETQKLADANEKLQDKLAKGRDIMNAGFGALEDIGLISGETAEAIGGLANAGMDIAEGFASGNPVQVIAGIGAAIGGLIDIFTGDGVGEAIERENAWMDITEEQTEALRELEEQLGSTHAATSVYLDELLDGAVTLENSDEWLYRIRETLSDVDQGTLSATEAVKEMGDAFEVWLEQAKELGTTGSKEFFDYVADLRNRGLEVVEINEFIVDSMKVGLDGYKDFLAGDFSDATIGVFEEMIAWETKVAEHQDLINGIKGLENALFGLSDAMVLNEEQFDSFEQAAVDGYDELIEQNFSANEALMLMAPTLQRLQYLQEEFGLEVDDATQKLIDEANANNLLNGDPMNRMADALEKFIKLMSDQLGLTTENTKAIDDQQRKWDNWRPDKKDYGEAPDFGGGGKGANDFNAASGADFVVPSGYPNDSFTLGVQTGEHVKVTPSGEDSGETIINLNVKIASDNPDRVLEQLIDGIKKNKLQVKTEIKRAVS